MQIIRPWAKIKFLFLLNIAFLLYSAFYAFQFYHQTYPSFFKMQNGQVSGFLHPSAEENLQYRDKILKEEIDLSRVQIEFERNHHTFKTTTDLRKLKGTFFFLFALLPWFTSLLYFLVAVFFFRSPYPFPEQKKLSVFLCLVSIYLSLLFVFHSGGFFSLLFLASFILSAQTLFRLAFSLGESSHSKKTLGFFSGKIEIFTFFLGFIIGIFYILGFAQAWPLWPLFEILALAYATTAYVFWLYRLKLIQKKEKQNLRGIFATFLFWGNFLSFISPLVALSLTYISTQNFSFHWAIPFSALLPLSLFLLSLLAALQDSQRRLHENEKMAMIGQLFSEMSHGIYNPLNFISVNLSTLKEYLTFLKNKASQNTSFKGKMSAEDLWQESETMLEEMNQGAQRIEKIVLELKEKSSGKK